MTAVKLGVSRQVAIPTKILDQLGLTPGEYLEVELEAGRLIFTPRTLINKASGRRRAGGLGKSQQGRSRGSSRQRRLAALSALD